ncbi:MAG: FAD-dependent oxidoreductase, partial [Eubacterium sp.]
MSIEPHVNPEVKYALYCKGAGVCSPYEMAIALAENAVKNGVKLFLETGVKDINRNGDDFDVISENGDIFNTHYVINAAGLYSDRISAMVGVDYFKILPRSGEYLLMVRGSGSAINQVLFQMPTKMGKGILVTPTYHGNLLIGPDAVNEGEADRDTHAERLLRIFKEATLTTDKLNIKQFIRSFTGVRAVSSTDDFIIEESTVPHFINVSGIQSPGITSSPAIAQMVRDILANAGLKLEADPNFDPYRKPIINRKELKPMKEILPLLDLPLGDQDRMICRCEQVSETTILDAMRRGIPVTTIDGIKRRTRAGMGWCQGTFCRPRVAEVMSKELGREINAEFDIEHSGV